MTARNPLYLNAGQLENMSVTNGDTITAGLLPLGTTSAPGALQPDGSTITVIAGVISSTGGGGSSAPMPNYLTGLTMSALGGHSYWTVNAGSATDSTNATLISLGSAFTKTTSAWAAGGSSQGSLDTGSIATNTWYHVFLISKAAGASSDILMSLSVSAPTMPSTYTLMRRIGSVATDASHNIIAFIQDNDRFSWLTPTSDVSATNPGTSAVLRTVSTPQGVRVQAILACAFQATTGVTDNPGAVYISDPSVADVVPAIGSSATIELYIGTLADLAAVSLLGTCYTNTSSQVRSRCQLSSTGTTLYIGTQGWIDPRGKL